MTKMEQHICSPLSVHKTMAKQKPKIRIIHIYAPEIIKTDAENFRELVQRLTGKPTTEERSNGCSFKKRTAIASIKKEPRVFSCSSKKMELAMRERIKGEEEEEEEIWRGAELGGGFLGAFADQLDGFMQEMNQLPGLEGINTNGYGEMQFS